MSRRAAEQDDDEPSSKRVKVVDSPVATTTEAPDADAEWEAFEKIISETKSAHANGDKKEDQDKTTIELDEEVVGSGEDDDDDEQVHDTWDEEEVKIERRREEHRKRREYLDKIRADRAKRIEEKKAQS